MTISSAAASPEQWLNHTASPESVLGPSRGWVPPLCGYRISAFHARCASLWIFGAVTGLPDHVPASGERGGARKLDLALCISLERLNSMIGMPMLDPVLDDSMHSFELALPVSVTIARTSEPLHPGSPLHVLSLRGESEHFSFDAHASWIGAYGGKHAAKRFSEAFYIRS